MKRLLSELRHFPKILNGIARSLGAFGVLEQSAGIRLAACLLALSGLASTQAETRVQFDPVAKTITLSVPEGHIPVEPWSLQYTPSLASPQDWQSIEPTNQTSLPSGEIEVTITIPESATGYFRFIGATPPSSNYPLILNEIMSNNQSSHPDDEGDFSDWIELYNPNPTPISLLSWHLTDNADNLSKWSFPDLEIPAMEYLLVYASGKNKLGDGAPLHSNFRISADGETIILSHGAGEIIDQVTLGRLANDESLGRSQSAESAWFIFQPSSTSPGLENDLEGARPFVAKPELVPAPGLYDEGFLFELSHPDPEATIFYTTDGSIPHSESLVYTAAFPIQSHTVIRAIAHDRSGDSSRVSSGSYLIGTQHTLPIVSLIAPAENFEIRDGFLYGFGEHMYPSSGFSANFPYSASNAWKDREIVASMEFYESTDREPLRQDIGLKVFGGWGSRGYPQKSLAIFARSRYGKGKIDYPLFPDLDIGEFESVILRNSGNDNQSTHHIPPRPPIREFGPTQGNGSYFVNGTFTLFRDAMMQTLASKLDVDRQAYRPTVLYLNGQYWGIYNLREKLNEHYVESHHGVSSDAVDLIEGYSQANAGSNRFYREAQSYIRRIDLSSDERFEVVASKYINISSFIDYHLAVIYFQNFDIGNIKQWRAQDGGTFRWMLYDQDYGFHLWPEEIYVPAMARDYGDYDNMFAFYTNPEGSGNGWPNASGRTQLLRRLLLNEDFKTQFITRCLDLLNTDFESERVKTTIETLAAQIRPEIPAHLTRWSWKTLEAQNHGVPFKPEDAPLNISHWEENVQVLFDFATTRPAKLREDLTQHFQLEDAQTTVTVHVQPANGGSVMVNSLDLKSSPWTGIYLQDIPTRLVAKAAEGFTFAEWSGGVTSSDSVETLLETTGQREISLTAHFLPVE